MMKKALSILLSFVFLSLCAVPYAFATDVDDGDLLGEENLYDKLLEEVYEEQITDSIVEDTFQENEPIVEDLTEELAEKPTEEEQVLTKETEILQSLGIMETEDYSKEVTRAEFVAAVVRLCGYSDEASVATAYFSDVPEGHEYEDAIAYAAGIKLVQGDGSNFRPNEAVTAEEAGIILLRALGHDNFSPYVPVDIVKARREGIYDGVGQAGNKPLTFDIAAKIIYNAMNQEMILVRGITSDGLSSALVLEKAGTTLLNCYQKIYMTKGRVTDNGFTSYSGETTVSDMCVRIDNNIYEKGNVDLSNLLGHEVEAYYNDENVLLCVYDITDENDIRYIAAEDIISSKLGVYQYENENGKIRTVSYAANANIVYNGKALKPGEYKDELLRPQIGGVKIIRANGEDYNLVVITSQFNCTIKSIKETDRGYMYVDADSKDKNISFDIDDIGRNVFIKDKYGSDYEVSEIVPYNVLSVAKSIDGKLLSITVSNSRGNGIISVLTSGANPRVTIEGVRYRLTHDADTTAVRVGDFGWFYLDVYGNIAHFRSYAEYEERYGYLLKAGVINDDDEAFAAKIFDESGHIIICMAEKRLMVDGTVVKSSGFNTLAESFYSGTDFQPCMIRFELNMDGRLISLDTYQNRETDDSLRKMEAPITMETPNTGIYDGMRRYRLNTYQFDGGLIIDSNTKIFAVPVGPHDDEDYKIIHMSTLQSNGYYDVEMYSTDSKSAVAEAMILYYAPKYDENTRNSKGYIRIPSFSTSYMQTGLVTDSQLILDKNGDCVREIAFLRFRNGQYYKYTMRWDDISDIEVGDIIRYYVFGDKIIDAEVVFDCNTQTVGTPRQISSTINTYVVRNNNCELADSSTTAANTKVINVSWMLSIMNAVSIHDGVLTGTLSEPSSTIEETDTRRAILGTICSGVYKYNSRAKTLTKSSVDEIICFEETQGECSKLLVQFQGAQTTAIIILE